MRGTLRCTPVYNVVCGRCEKANTFYDVPSYQWAVMTARLYRWSLTKKDGWVCPKCVR